MIFYFSATGNTKHVVDEIRLDGEKIISIEEATKSGTYTYTLSDERLGILTPTYDWGLPSIVYEFLEKFELKFNDKPYTFYVGTFGTITGAASSITDTLLKKKGLKLDAKFDIRMPDTWTVMFDLSDPSDVAEKIRKADIEIALLKEQLANKLKGKYMDFTVAEFVGRIGKSIYDKKVRKTVNLSVSDACIDCGLCARKCPVNAIEMKNKKPVWIRENCTMCLGCLHRCPKYAIFYGSGSKTNAHGQYTYERYSVYNKKS